MLRKRASEGAQPCFSFAKSVAPCVYHIWLEFVSVRMHFFYPNKELTARTQTELLVVPYCYT